MSMNIESKLNQFQFIARDVKKSYWTANIETKALDGISLNVGKGDFKMILGPSGSGKTTLMNIFKEKKKYVSYETCYK